VGAKAARHGPIYCSEIISTHEEKVVPGSFSLYYYRRASLGASLEGTWSGGGRNTIIMGRAKNDEAARGE